MAKRREEGSPYRVVGTTDLFYYWWCSRYPRFYIITENFSGWVKRDRDRRTRIACIAASPKCISCGAIGEKLVISHNPNDKHSQWRVILNIVTNDGLLLTADHIKPASKGGRTELSNLQTMCSPCNQRKADCWENSEESTDEHRKDDSN